jgi:hypothetical protein
VQKMLLFLASPGDVGEERDGVATVLRELNHGVAADRNLVLEERRWEFDTRPQFGADAQALVNSQIAEMGEYDLFIGIMATRIGSATPRFASGTIEEYESAKASFSLTTRPDIWFYFRDPAGLQEDDSAEQLDQVRAFERQVRQQAIVWRYGTPQNFRDLLPRHLTRWILERPGTAARSELGVHETDPREDEAAGARPRFAVTQSGHGEGLSRQPTALIPDWRIHQIGGAGDWQYSVALHAERGRVRLADQQRTGPRPDACHGRPSAAHH